MPINESVYGARENWYVPGNRTELGHQYSGDAYYYNDIASDDKLKIKVANFNTLSNPVTSFCSQIDGQYTSENYLIRNNWTPTQTDPIDRSIVQFGMGPQSGLADIEWWGVEWVTGQSEPTTSVDPTILNHDKYNIVNIGLGLAVDYVPPMNYTAGSASNLATGDMLITGAQYTNRQIWGDQRCYFSTDSDSFYNYHVASGYAFLNFITQIPIKNLKIYPKITAYKSDTQWKQFNSIQDYLAEKNDYPLLGCIEAMFRYRSGLNDTTDYNSSVSITPIFTDKTTVLKGYQNGTSPDEVIRDENLWYSRSWRSHFVIAGRYGYDQSGTHGMMNDIYWVATYDSRPYTYAIFDAVYQTPDFKFTLDANKCFTCDTSSMTDDQITEGIRRQLASFGMFFVDDIDDINLALDDEKTFLGILKDGVGFGDYSHGAKNREQDQWNWDTMEQNDYDPKNPPMIDPNLYGVDMSFNAPWVSSPHTLYSFNSVATGLLTIQQLFHKLWENYADKKDEWIQGQDHTIFNWNLNDFNYDQYLMMNPIDCIVSLKLFPYNTAQNPESEYTTIKLGKFNTSIPARTAYYYKKFDFGSATIFPYFGAQHQQTNGNWMDRLTQYTFYAPFCGTAEIDANKYMGKELHLTYTIDQITGACTATLEATGADGAKVHIVSLTGTCAVDIPITGLNQATIQSQIFNANQQLKAANTRTLFGLANDVTSMITNPSIPGLIGAAGKFASNDINVESAKYNLHHQQVSPHTINSASPLCGMMMDYIPRIIVSQPVIADNFSEATFKENKGFACIIPGTIGSHKGYFEINDFKWAGDGTPTDTEIEMIRSLLAGGVYVG